MVCFVAKTRRQVNAMTQAGARELVGRLQKMSGLTKMEVGGAGNRCSCDPLSVGGKDRDP